MWGQILALNVLMCALFASESKKEESECTLILALI